MTTYNGTFTVVNCTNSTITNVTVVHTCASFTNSATAGSLTAGQAVSTSLNTQSGSNDLWSITFTMNGQTYSRSNKQCNYVSEDAPLGVVISLYVKSFSVLLPESSSCLNNYYSTPSTAKDEALAAAETTGGVKED